MCMHIIYLRLIDGVCANDQIIELIHLCAMECPIHQSNEFVWTELQDSASEGSVFNITSMSLARLKYYLGK